MLEGDLGFLDTLILLFVLPFDVKDNRGQVCSDLRGQKRGGCPPATQQMCFRGGPVEHHGLGRLQIGFVASRGRMWDRFIAFLGLGNGALVAAWTGHQGCLALSKQDTVLINNVRGHLVDVRGMCLLHQ